MTFEIMRLNEFHTNILEYYKKDFKIPLNVEANNVIIIYPSIKDDGKQIKSLVKLIIMSKIALVVFDSTLFYNCNKTRVSNYYEELLTKKGLFKKIEYNSKNYIVFGQFNSGLIY